MMVAAMFLAGAFSLATAAAPGWPALLALRFLTGVALAGVPAVAMAYVAEEVDHASVGSAMGLYIAGSAIGGMAGRLGVSLLTDLAGWRGAIAAVGVAGLVMAEAFRRLAPASRHFTPTAQSPRQVAHGFLALFRDRAMPLLFVEAFVLMGVFVSLYNYAGFRLMAAPYHLGHAAVGAIFLLYLLGSASSAWFGGMAGRVGRRRLFWVPTVLLIVGVRANRRAAARAGHRRDRGCDDRLLRGAFDRQRLGRAARTRAARPGGGAVPVLLLCRVERARVARRNRLDGAGLAGGRVVLRRAGRRRAGHRAGIAHRAAVAGPGRLRSPGRWGPTEKRGGSSRNRPVLPKRRDQSFPVSSGTILNRSPTRPMSATWKIGASSSLLIAMIVFESFMPARCWIAPEMPIAI